MHRTMVWVQTQSAMGWGCSECGWVFRPSGAPVGKSMDEVTQAFVLQRDKEFAVHACLEYSNRQAAGERPIK